MTIGRHQESSGDMSKRCGVFPEEDQEIEVGAGCTLDLHHPFGIESILSCATLRHFCVWTVACPRFTTRTVNRAENNSDMLSRR